MKKSLLLSTVIASVFTLGLTPAQAACSVSNVRFSFNMPLYYAGGGWAYVIKYDAVNSGGSPNCVGAQGNYGVFIDRVDANGASLQSISAPAGLGQSRNLSWSFSSAGTEYLRIRSGNTVVFGPFAVKFPSYLNTTLGAQATPGKVTVNWSYLGTLQNADGFTVRRSHMQQNGSFSEFQKLATVRGNNFSYEDTSVVALPVGTVVKYLVQPLRRQNVSQNVVFTNGMDVVYNIPAVSGTVLTR